MTQRLSALVIAGLLAMAGSAIAAQEPEAPGQDRPAVGEGPRLNPRFEQGDRPRNHTPETGRPQEDTPGQVRGESVERRNRPAQEAPRVAEQRRHGGGGGGGTVIIEGRGGRGRAGGPPPRVYEVRPRVEARARVTVAPRRIYPYAYGGFGLGYFYYDPYWSPWGGWGYPRGVYGYYDDRRDYLGRVRLDVRGPREATVLVDGYYAGTLDDFDGTFQGLDLEAGTYRIEVEADGFETLVFDTRISDGRKITLHGAMRRTDGQ